MSASPGGVDQSISTEQRAGAPGRGAPRGAPRPHRPSVRFIGGWRAATILPVGFWAVGVGEWSTGQPQRYGPVGLVLAGLCVLAGVVTTWVLAARPRLTNAESRRLPHDLGRAKFRELRRAVFDRDPIPVDLRPWAAAYVGKRRSDPVSIGYVVALVATVALTASPTGTVLDMLVLVALGLLLAGLVVAVGAAWWLCHSAERLELPMHPIATGPARSAR